MRDTGREMVRLGRGKERENMVGDTMRMRIGETE